MNAQQQREKLEAELHRQRLPHAYIQRLLAEWDDHLADLQDERSTDMAGKPDIGNFDQRLGNPAQLAVIAARQYHNRSFLGRHRILTFLILPLPTIVGCVIATGLAFYAVAFGVYWALGAPKNIDELSHPYLSSFAMVGLSWLLFVLPPLITALLSCRIARRNELNWRWPTVTCLLIAIYAGVFSFTWQLATNSGGNGMVMIGFDLGTSRYWICLKFLPKFTLALGVGLLLIKRAQRLQKIDENRAETRLFRQAA